MSKSDTFYFSHDANAHNDPKIIKLRRVTGPAGYGCFWILIELLREQPLYELHIDSIADLAYEKHLDEQLLTTVIHDFDLFIIENGTFYSARLIRSMVKYNELRDKKSQGAKKANEKRWGDQLLTTGLSVSDQLLTTGLSVSDQLSIPKEIKGNKKKSKENTTKNEDSATAPLAPLEVDVVSFFVDNLNLTADEGTVFFNKYNALGWIYEKRCIKKSWKHLAKNWPIRAQNFKKEEKGSAQKEERIFTWTDAQLDQFYYWYNYSDPKYKNDINYYKAILKEAMKINDNTVSFNLKSLSEISKFENEKFKSALQRFESKYLIEGLNITGEEVSLVIKRIYMHQN